MNKIRVIICDDYEQDRDRYEETCREIGEKHHIPLELRTYVNGDDLLFDLEQPEFYVTVDILLLNIHMPGPDGIEVARRAREIGYQNLIIFVTRSKEYYEPAFDVKGFNYITKGKEGNEERFEKVFLTALKEAGEQSRKSLVLSSGGYYKQIDIAAIKYFEVNKNLVTVYYNDQSFEFISTLNKLENQLFSQGFCRVQKAYLVSLDYVKSFTFKELLMDNGIAIPIGRKYYKELKERMEDLAGRIKEK